MGGSKYAEKWNHHISKVLFSVHKFMAGIDWLHESQAYETMGRVTFLPYSIQCQLALS